LQNFQKLDPLQDLMSFLNRLSAKYLICDPGIDRSARPHDFYYYFFPLTKGKREEKEKRKGKGKEEKWMREREQRE